MASEEKVVIATSFTKTDKSCSSSTNSPKFASSPLINNRPLNQSNENLKTENEDGDDSNLYHSSGNESTDHPLLGEKGEGGSGGEAGIATTPNDSRDGAVAAEDAEAVADAEAPPLAAATATASTAAAAAASTTAATAPARRSSFGLGFLSTITSTIRSQAVAAATATTPPANENMQHFMSNSPTIANLSTYASQGQGSGPGPGNPTTTTTTNASSQNESQAPAINGDASATDQNTRSESSGSDFDQTTDANNLTRVNEDPAEYEVDQVQMSLSAELEDANKFGNGLDKDGFFSVRLTPLIDHSSSSAGLYFSPVIRKVRPANTISIGRYTEKNKSAAHAPQGSSAPIVFKSKVVSRTHALFQCNDDGQWFLKDCKSSSGTFLNHVRLSPPSHELTLMPLIDGDVIQLGMDYRGGTEEVYRCVKMRCEFNKSWQRKVNQFNLEIHKKLKNLAIGAPQPETSMNAIGKALANDDLSECAICLLKLDPCQALFISPCSHCWHYKCIRPIIIKSYPQFYCPNCRSMCDLETDIEDD